MSRTMLKSCLVACLAAATLTAAAQGTTSTGSGQAYPTRPVKMITPFPPGGTLDAVGRQLAQKLGEQMGGRSR